MTDILVTTRNRLALLQQTLEHIYGRTRSPYRLHVVDDCSRPDAASGGGNADWLWEEFKAGRVHHLYLRGEHVGAMGNLNLLAWASFSDPVVLTDDDVLCPDVEPDWLSRGLSAMERHPEVGMLALHHPGAKLKGYRVAGEVTYCESLGGTFLFVRRAVLERFPLPHRRGLLDRPMAPRCEQVREAGWKIAYLTRTYCYHTGKKSALTGSHYQGPFIEPESWKTLEPRERWRC